MAVTRFCSSTLLTFMVILALFWWPLPDGLLVVAHHGNETDRQALIEMKAKITSDPLGVLSSWNDSFHFCQWFGVTCGRKHQRVTELDLRSLKLGGSISPHIGNLSFLHRLVLANNSFRDQIPPQVSHLSRLQDLILSNNSLSGKIPSNISSCFNLAKLYLPNNNLTGGISVEIGSLLKLEVLSMGKNSLTGGIPVSLGNLSSLGLLYLSENNLGGTIPSTLGELENLNYLSLNENNLSGIVPSSIFNLSSITVLQLLLNQLKGNLPPDVFISLPNVHDFSVGGNQFTGPIPPSLSNASNLEFLQLLYNNLTGEVPRLIGLNRLRHLSIGFNDLGGGGLGDLNFFCSLTNASDLDTLHLSGNKFEGVLPECLGNLSSELRTLWFAYNRITGRIPIGIGNLIKLISFGAYGNFLSGTIPQTTGNLKNLSVLYLHENKLSGHIPSSLGNLTNLLEFTSFDNNLQGVIPSSLGDCRNLLTLELSQNNLSGTIPAQVIGLSSLTFSLDLSQNHLIGSIPSKIGNLIHLGELDLSNNLLSGEIPADLGTCRSLEYLKMEENYFQGPIPSSLESLNGLKYMDLSQNNLSGKIPEYLASFDLLYLNLSFNELGGVVPIGGVFKNSSATSIMGNKKLCGGLPIFHLPVCNNGRSNHKRKKVIIATISATLGVCLALFVTLLLRSKKKRRESNPSSISTKFFLQLSFHDLHKATEGFSQENLIGVGSFGFVYKGILNINQGMIIAVKVLNLMHDKAINSFMAECEALRNIRHRNLVKVLTACSSVDYQGNDFKALVYEFMENGSLEEWLHPPPPLQSDVTHAQEEKNLTLLQRLNIAIHVASALEYLHFQCENPIVHCDLKPSNVLLDDEFTGHISDFGLAKLLSNNIQKSSSTIGVRGTIGYAPPEYGLGSNVSPSGDVYSYGILLLEMFTRKRPTDEMFQEDLSLHILAEKSLSTGLVEFIDPILLNEIATNRRGQDKVVKSLTSILDIGVACSAQLPRERLDIHEAISRLCHIRDKLIVL